ncbi:hypothetical protein AKJ16_DCAP00494 [Drosera capensis]
MDPSDKLYLHHSDHPNCSLASKPLYGDNYGHWRHAVEVSLLSKKKKKKKTNKLGFVKSTTKKPTDESGKVLQWERCNNMVISWLLHSVGNEITESVVYCETAAEISEELEKRFGQANGARIFQKQGHLIEKCYKLHGFPSRNGNQKGIKMNANVAYGHEEENLMGEDSKEHGSEQEKGKNTGCLTKDQFGQLLSLLGKLGVQDNQAGSIIKNSGNNSMLAGPFNEEATGSRIPLPVPTMKPIDDFNHNGNGHGTEVPLEMSQPEEMPVQNNTGSKNGTRHSSRTSKPPSYLEDYEYYKP